MEEYQKLKEAIDILENCDPADCDCDNCPIGKKVALDAHDASIHIVSTVCGLLQAVHDCYTDEDFLYKSD